MLNFVKNKTVIVACLFFIPLFFSTSVFAYSASITTSGTVTIDVLPKGNGSAGTNISAEEINVVTDCRAGYNLTISGPSDRNLYRNGDSSNNTSGQYFTPVDGTSALKNTSNAWGYSLTANTEDGVFAPLSNTPAFLKTPSQTASQTNINDTFSIYYGVSVSASLNPGSYAMSGNGAIVYQLTMDSDCRAFDVAFNANGGTGTMGSQAITVDSSTKLNGNSFDAPAMGTSYQDANGTTIPAVADKFWVFWGWNTEVDGTGDWYKDKESVTNLANENETITLYAQWKQAVIEDMATPTSGTKTITHNTMQDMSSVTCYNSEITTKAALEAASKTGAVTLTDNRDGTVRSYDVSKLADGNCWMTTNLALGTTTAVTLSSDDTDLAEGTTFTLPAGDTSRNTTNTAAKIRLTNSSSSTANGVYYSWAAAVANTTSTSGTLTTSICPKKWDLPTSNQFSTLISTSAYSSTNSPTDLPSHFNANGGYTDGRTFSNASNYSYYWSASSNTSNATSSAIGVMGNSSSLSTSNSNKYYRRNIRCVANMDEMMRTITFVNTATSETQEISFTMGQNVTIQPTTAYTRSGYKLTGWDTNNAGTSIVYTNGQSVANLYSNLTVYTVWAPSYAVVYNGNNSDAGAMSNVSHTNVAEGDTLNLFASNYSREDYGFAGWSFDQSAQPGGSSRIYGPNETISAPAFTGTPGANATMTLYAVWIHSAGDLQNWTGCSSLAKGAVTALSDARDDNTYAIAKLADEKCWMIENLRLDNTNSDNSTGALSQGYNTSFVGLASPESANFSNSTTANSLYYSGTASGTATIDIGTNNNPGYRFPRFNNTNTASRVTNMSSASSNVYSYGNYYSFAAAIANANQTAVATNTSICPAGWHIPTGVISGDMNNLSIRLGGNYNTMNSSSTPTGAEMSKVFRSYPNNFVYSGNISGSSILSRGSSGEYWTANPLSSSPTYANFLSLSNSEVSPGNTSRPKSYGEAIRCLINS